MFFVMKKSILFVAILIVFIGMPAESQSFNITFNYQINVSVRAQIQQAGIRFRNVDFVPQRGTPIGTAHFDVSSTGACNIRMLARYGSRMVPVFDTGYISPGRIPMYVSNVNRGDYQEFIVIANDCNGNVIAQDRVTFWTPPPEIVTVDQWETYTVSRRTVRVGYN